MVKIRAHILPDEQDKPKHYNQTFEAVWGALEDMEWYLVQLKDVEKQPGLILAGLLRKVQVKHGTYISLRDLLSAVANTLIRTKRDMLQGI